MVPGCGQLLALLQVGALGQTLQIPPSAPPPLAPTPWAKKSMAGHKEERGEEREWEARRKGQGPAPRQLPGK